MTGEHMWKPGEVARLMKVGPKTVTRWVRAGRLAAIRTPGGQVRIPNSAVQAMYQPEGGAS